MTREIPDALLFDGRVSAQGVRFYAALARRESASDAEVGASLGLSNRSVRRLLAELARAGWIERLPGQDALPAAKNGHPIGEPRVPLVRELLTTTTKNTAANNGRPPPSFDDFWSVYPRKTGKGAARKSFIVAVKKATARDICNAAWRFAQDPNLPEKQFIPHPATWLNQERWEDEPQPERNGSTSTAVQRTRENLMRFMGGDDDGRPEGGRDRADAARRDLQG